MILIILCIIIAILEYDNSGARFKKNDYTENRKSDNWLLLYPYGDDD